MTRYHRRALWVLIICGVLLRLHGITAASIWFDESFQLTIVRLPLVETVRMAAEDYTPPAWFLIQWPVIHLFGDSLLALRLPSVLASIGTLVLVAPVTWALTRSGAAAVLGTAMIAIMPYALWMAHDARVYSWLSLVAMLALWLGLRGRWGGFAAALGLGLWSHTIAAIYWPAVVLTVVNHHRWRWGAVRAAGVASLVAIVSYLPWLPATASRLAQTDYWLPPESQAPIEVAYTVSVVWFANASVFAALVGFGALLIAVAVGIVTRANRSTFLLWALPLAALGAVAWLVRPVIYYRPLSVLGVFVALWLAGVLVGRSMLKRYALVLIMTALVIGAVQYDPRTRGGYLDTLPSAPVWVHATGTTLLPIRYHQPDAEHYLIASDHNPTFWTAPAILDAAGVTRVAEPPCPALLVVPDDVYLFDPARGRFVPPTEPIVSLHYWHIPAIRVYDLPCDEGFNDKLR